MTLRINVLSTTSGTSAGHSGPSASPATRLALDASTEHSCSHKSPGHLLILTDHRPVSDGLLPSPLCPQDRLGLASLELGARAVSLAALKASSVAVRTGHQSCQRLVGSIIGWCLHDPVRGVGLILRHFETGFAACRCRLCRRGKNPDRPRAPSPLLLRVCLQLYRCLFYHSFVLRES